MPSIMSQSILLFGWVSETTIQISCFIIGILLLKRIFNESFPAWWHYGIWLLLFFRILTPWSLDLEYLPFSSFFQSLHFFQDVVVSSKNNSIPETFDFGGWVRNNAAKIPSAVSISIIHAVYGVWVLGVFFFGGLIVFKNLNLWVSVRKERLLTDQPVLDVLEDCKKQVNVKTVLGIVATDRVNSPALFGYIRPRLLLPKQILNQFDHNQMRYVFLHELMHLKHHHIGVNWVLLLFHMVHWFNPLVWVMLHQISVDQEYACDHSVLITTLPDERERYAALLISFLEHYCSNRKFPAMAGIVESKSQIKRRLKMIINHQKQSKIMAIGMYLLLMLLIMFTPGFSMEKMNSNGASEPQIKEQAAVSAAIKWLDSVDSQNYAESWTAAASIFKDQVTEVKWRSAMKISREPLGEKLTRKLSSARYVVNVPNAPEGEYYLLLFETEFKNKTNAIETVTPFLDSDGKWRVSGYYIK